MIIVGYTRLSKDEDKENYSSIESQMSIINECSMKYFGKEVDKFYIDDNFSGYTYDRPAFMEMKAELDNDKIDVIIAKDLSRLGRHNAKTLLLIEEIQLMGKRILLPEQGGGYDSDSGNDDTLGIDTWYNERYVKDISKKVRSSVKDKQKHGAFLIREYFGYRKDPADKHKLIIDEDTAWIVKLIFEKYIEGMGSRKIANYLSDNNIPTPSQIIKKHKEDEEKIYKGSISVSWYATLVQRILVNDIYKGTLRLRKSVKKGIKGKAIKTKEEDQFIFENNHEPIISKENFDLVAQINVRRKLSGYRGGKINNYIFTGLLFCMDCGKSLVGHTSQHGVASYICTTFHNRGKEYCQSHRISEKQLLADVKEYLTGIKEKYEDLIRKYTVTKSTNDYPKLIKKLEKELVNATSEFKSILVQKTKDINKQKDEESKNVLEESYNEIEDEKRNKIIGLKKQIEELIHRSEIDVVSELYSSVDLFTKIIETDNVNKKQVEFAIQNILVNSNIDLEINLNDKISKLSKLEKSLEQAI